MVDLSPLNAAERRILTLLAQGHTAKSIAAETGASLHSVNERLREARRKTGIGSSRELARLLPQENRDDQIGVAQAAPGGTERMGNFARYKGWIVMTAIAATALLAFLLVPHAAPQPPRVVSTSPASSGVVASGSITITVTFDQPMQARSYSFVMLDPATYPDCAREPRQSADKRSFALDCRVAPGRSYAIGFNLGKFRNFKSAASGLPAQPATLRFTTR